MIIFQMIWMVIKQQKNLQDSHKEEPQISIMDG